MIKEEYLNGRKLCEMLGVNMYQRIVIRHHNGQHFGSQQDEGKYFISPLGVVVKCNDGVGLFEVPRSRELWNKLSTISQVFDEYISPKEVRYNKNWLEEMSLRAGIEVRTKDAGTVGRMEVPAVRFKRNQFYK